MLNQTGKQLSSLELDLDLRRGYECAFLGEDSFAQYQLGLGPVKGLTEFERMAVNFLIVFIAYTCPSSLHRTAETCYQLYPYLQRIHLDSRNPVQTV
jgi:hypothetical protein